MSSTAYLLLGSNEGERLEWFRKCIALIAEKCGTITAQSGIYETAAWGLEDQPDFLNMAVCIETSLNPEDLLKAIQAIEHLLGRQRKLKWGQRTLDIDILLYNDEVVNTSDLNIPHPHMQDRRFVLAPLSDIAPNAIHPTLNISVQALLARNGDPLPVKLLLRSL